MNKHELKKRPYNKEEAKELLLSVMSEETINWHYNTHHNGYVAKLNEIKQKLIEKKEEILSKANANYSEFGELKRRETFNENGVILHELFWDNLGGNGEINNAPKLLNKIINDFGSVKEFEEELSAVALSAKNSGWAVVAIDSFDENKIKIFLVDEHGVGAVWGATPLIALDVFEHAYYHKNGPNRKEYIQNFIKNINWERVEKNFLAKTNQE